MNSIEIIRLVLIISAVLVVVAAAIAGIIIFIRIRKIKKNIAISQNEIIASLESNEDEIKMRERHDFGEPLYEVQKALSNNSVIKHEIVEFCINSCIRNNYKNILLIGDVEPYEAITISNKSEATITVLENEFNLNKYNEIKEQLVNINHNLNVIKDKSDNQSFDAIMILNSTSNFLEMFNSNVKYLREKGMFIIANIKSNKKSTNALIKDLIAKRYRYDKLNWYTGFLVIVK